MSHQNKSFPTIAPFQRELSSFSFNYIFDTGKGTDGEWRPLEQGDYGDFTISTLNQTVNAIPTTVGITGQPVYVTGEVFAKQMDDWLVGITGQPIHVTGQVEATQAGDWLVGITGQPIHVTGDFKTEGSQFISGLVGITGQPLHVTGQVEATQAGDWSVAITGQPVIVEVTGQPLHVTGTMEGAPSEIAITGFIGPDVIDLGTFTGNYSGSGVMVKDYSNHSYHVIQEDPNIDAVGATIVIEITNDEDANYYPIYAMQVMNQGNIELPDLYWGADGYTGGFYYNDWWTCNYSRISIQDYSSGTFRLLEHHTP